MAILAVNAGSSTLKFSVYPMIHGQVAASLLAGCIQGLEPGGTPVLEYSFQGEQKNSQLPAATDDPFDQALHSLGDLLTHHPSLPDIQAISHRVVHGGRDFVTSTRVTEDVLSRLEKLNSLAPLHQPHNLQGIHAFQKAFPKIPQVACFDTAFHATLSEGNYSFALPQSLSDEGVRRYGFHGLSYQYIMGVLQQHSTQAQGRVLMAHLGNGASLCAAQNGRSCATTMGFSALDGLMMGTRSGALDPGVLLYLMQERGLDAAAIEDLLYRKSGLLGVSGISSDMRTLRKSTAPEAAEAVALFVYRIVREMGSLAAALGGIDGIVFTAGIGENDAATRAEIAAGCGWLGVTLDEGRNRDGNGRISADGSRVSAWVVPTDEERMIARYTRAALVF